MDGMIPRHHQDLFATQAFPVQGLSVMLISPGQGSCHHHGSARALARCHCKQWVPGRLIGLGVRSFTLEFYNKTPFLLWIVKNNVFFNNKIPMICQFKTYLLKKIILRKKSSVNWFTPFYVAPLWSVTKIVLITQDAKGSSTCKHQQILWINDYIDRINHNHITQLTKITLNNNEQNTIDVCSSLSPTYIYIPSTKCLKFSWVQPAPLLTKWCQSQMIQTNTNIKSCTCKYWWFRWVKKI